MSRKLKVPDNVYFERETKKLYKKIRVGTDRFAGMYLWQPMKRGLFSYVPDKSKEPFWLDDRDFTLVSGKM